MDELEDEDGQSSNFTLSEYARKSNFVSKSESLLKIDEELTDSLASKSCHQLFNANSKPEISLTNILFNLSQSNPSLPDMSPASTQEDLELLPSTAIGGWVSNSNPVEDNPANSKSTSNPMIMKKRPKTIPNIAKSRLQRTIMRSSSVVHGVPLWRASVSPKTYRYIPDSGSYRALKVSSSTSPHANHVNAVDIMRSKEEERRSPSAKLEMTNPESNIFNKLTNFNNDSPPNSKALRKNFSMYNIIESDNQRTTSFAEIRSKFTNLFATQTSKMSTNEQKTLGATSDHKPQSPTQMLGTLESKLANAMTIEQAYYPQTQAVQHRVRKPFKQFKYGANVSESGSMQYLRFSPQVQRFSNVLHSKQKDKLELNDSKTNSIKKSSLSTTISLPELISGQQMKVRIMSHRPL